MVYISIIVIMKVMPNPMNHPSGVRFGAQWRLSCR
jgi:hypothetical protein